MRPRYLALLAAGGWLAIFANGCSSVESVKDEVTVNVIHEDPVRTYYCSPAEHAGMVPHKPNEMHCCMTDVEEQLHNDHFTLTGSGGEHIEIGGEVPNYIRAELKAAGRVDFDVDGTLVSSEHAKHEATAHCSTHTATDPGECKPKYVRSRYDIDGRMTVTSEHGLDLGAILQGLLKALVPVNLDFGVDSKSVTVQEHTALCVEADHDDSECSPLLDCTDGGPGCALTDAGTEGGYTQLDPCQGKVGAECLQCCKESASTAEEYEACTTQC